MFSHIPKINAGLGCFVLLCFFLPWVSFSCGTVTFLKLSGYHLTAGKIPVDEPALKQYEQRAGNIADDDRIPGDVKTSAPKFVYLIVVICAVNIVGFSLRMFEGEISRVQSTAVLVFAGVGSVFMIAAAAFDFGITIPSDSETFIQSSLEIGYFGTVAGFAASTVLAFLSLKVLGQSRVYVAPAELQLTEEAFSGPEGIRETESFSKDVAEHFGVTAAKKPEVQAPAPVPPGVKTCPACSTVVGLYQVKCLKCGSALKPGK